MFASRGLTRRQIADATAKSPETIKTQLNFCRLKLGAKTTTHAVAEAIRRDLIP